MLRLDVPLIDLDAAEVRAGAADRECFALDRNLPDATPCDGPVTQECATCDIGCCARHAADHEADTYHGRDPFEPRPLIDDNRRMILELRVRRAVASFAPPTSLNLSEILARHAASGDVASLVSEVERLRALLAFHEAPRLGDVFTHAAAGRLCRVAEPVDLKSGGLLIHYHDGSTGSLSLELLSKHFVRVSRDSTEEGFRALRCRCSSCERSDL